MIKIFAKRLDFKDIKLSVKIRDIHKIEKKNSMGISVFGYENKEKHPSHLSKKCCEDKHIDLSLIGEGEKKHYVLIKNFNTFMYDHTLHSRRKHFCCYCLHAFVNITNFKAPYWRLLNGKQRIIISKKGEHVKFKNFERKNYHSSFMQILKVFLYLKILESNKYQKHIACSYGYKLVCSDDKFSKPFKPYLGEDAVYNFISKKK